MNMNEYELEKKKLFDTLNIIREVLSDEQTDLKKLYNNFIGNREE